MFLPCYLYVSLRKHLVIINTKTHSSLLHGIELGWQPWLTTFLLILLLPLLPLLLIKYLPTFLVILIPWCNFCHMLSHLVQSHDQRSEGQEQVLLH